MGKKAKSPAEKERYAADMAAHRLAKMYQKTGYHVHDESEADERESVMSHMLRDCSEIRTGMTWERTKNVTVSLMKS